MRLNSFPLTELLKRMKEHGAHLSKTRNIIPWTLKFLLLDPLRRTEKSIYAKQIKHHQIDVDPIFILGFYRSGTTYLQRLLLQDTQFAHQTVVDTAYPEIMLSMEWLIKPFLNAWKMIAKPENRFQRIPLQWDQPREKELAMLSHGWDESAAWGFLFPAEFENYFERYILFKNQDMRKRWKQRYLFWLQKLSIKYPNRQLLLKNPPNMARIPLLLELFPNAKFIFIYRNPYNVYASNQYLWEIISNNYAFQDIEQERISTLIIYSYQLLPRQYLADRTLIPEGHLFEVSYEKLARNPTAMLKHIYSSLQILGWNAAKQKVEENLSAFTSYPKKDIY